jgi:PBSX family phage portal protein
MSVTVTKKAEETIQDPKGQFRVIAFDVNKQEEDPPESRTIANPWDSVELTDGIIMPPVDPFGLLRIIDRSSDLGASVSAMEVNIPGFGWRIKRLPGSVDAALADEEAEDLTEFLNHADYEENSFTQLRRRTRKEMESIGNAYWEVIRDTAGTIDAFRLVPGLTVRLTSMDPFPTEVERQRAKGTGDERHFVTKKIKRRFRRFVQARHVRNSDEPELVWFKEYGDPRKLNWRTGKFEGDGDDEEDVIAPKDEASEIFHWKIYSATSPYGQPRWLGALLSAMGIRTAEEVNFITFKNNNVPSLALLVSGGILTDSTIDRITEFVETNIQGSDNYSKFLVIEAVPDEEEGDAAQIRLDIKPLTREQHTDALFQEYDRRSSLKIRESFRLPDFFLGATENATRATAIVSRNLTDEQVFNPERIDEDFTINRILVDRGMLHHVFVTNSPSITNNEDLVRMLAAGERTGGMTPRVAHGVLEEIVGTDLPLPEGIGLDTPFSLQMAEAVKNKADPTQPGQQVTALKSIPDLRIWVSQAIDLLKTYQDEEEEDEALKTNSLIDAFDMLERGMELATSTDESDE